MLIEVLATTVGTAVAKTAMKFWFGDSELAGAAGDSVAELIKRKVRGYSERKKLEHQFEHIALVVAERLDPYFRTEFRGLPHNEKEAAAHAAAATLDQVPLTRELLLAHDLDGESLLAHVLAHDRGRADAELLSDAGRQLYAFTLDQACRATVETVLTLPQFDGEMHVETLRRLTETLARLDEALARLPAPVPDEDPARAFEQRYRHHIAEKVDRLELFGLTLTRQRRMRYSLSVAYITLTAGTAERAFVGVDQVLEQGDRLLIRGQAGSGKTTLLQWIAVEAARGGVGVPEAWRDRVPVLIRLRGYADERLPAPEEFLAHEAGVLAGEKPAGWVSDLLRAGRAIVLVDGVDEVSDAARAATEEWLRDLCRSYARSVYVVTSRPPAVAEDWLADAGFSVADLQPMEAPDVVAFVEHWHQAAGRLLDDEEQRLELDRLRRALLAQLRGSRALRDLATSPLLCAMLCALNWDRNAALPRERLRLYGLVLETLVQRREAERRIDIALDLELKVKLRLLSHLAYWMLDNGLAEVDRDRAEGNVASRLESLGIGAEPEEVIDHLLVRSGVIREPSSGRIDFIHKTFQEYLAAEEAIRRDNIEALVARAHEDQWRDVIPLAAGHAEQAQAGRLIRGLIARGDAEPDHRQTLHLLAVGCLDFTTELDPAVRTELDELIRLLVPPRNLSEAASLAAGGEHVAPLLRGFHTAKVPVATAVVRALGLIGDEQALDVLRDFGAEKRQRVISELLRAWPAFDVETYARDVLGDSPLLDGTLEIRDPSFLPALRHLRHVLALTCDCSFGAPELWADIEPLRSLTSLELLVYRNAVELTDASALADLRRLTQLELTGASTLRTLPPLAESLTVARLDGCFELVDLSGLAGCRLAKLSAMLTGAEDLAPLAGVERLVKLDLRGAQRVIDAGPLADLPRLWELRVGARWPGEDIRSLLARPSAALRTLGDRAGYRNLASFTAAGCRHLTDLSALAGAARLRALTLSDVPIEDLEFLGEHPHLQALIVCGAPALTRMDGIERAPAIKAVVLRGTAVEDLTPLRALTALETLDLTASERLSDLSPLAGLPSLQAVDVTNCRADATALERHGVTVWRRSDLALNALADSQQVLSVIETLPSDADRSAIEDILAADVFRSHRLALIE